MGSLAYSFSQDDLSVFEEHDSPRPIRRFAGRNADSSVYLRWLKSRSVGPEALRLIELANAALRKASWPWAKAFVLAAAYPSSVDEFVRPESVGVQGQ